MKFGSSNGEFGIWGWEIWRGSVKEPDTVNLLDMKVRGCQRYCQFFRGYDMFEIFHMFKCPVTSVNNFYTLGYFLKKSKTYLTFLKQYTFSKS
jgi:hypothetical protein